MAVRPTKYQKNRGEELNLFRAAAKERKEEKQQEFKAKRDEAEARRASWEARQDLIRRRVVRISVAKPDEQTEKRVRAYRTAVQLSPDFSETYQDEAWIFAVVRRAGEVSEEAKSTKPVEIGVEYKS